MYDNYRTTYTVRPRLQPAEKPQGTRITEEQLAVLWKAEREPKREEAPKPPRETPRDRRKAQIMELMADGRERTVDEIARRFGVTRETIRKDLHQFSASGMLTEDSIYEGHACTNLYRLEATS